MTSLKRRPWTNGLAAAVIAVVGLATLTLPPRQAQAQVSVGIGFGVPGVWGYYASPPYYYPYAAYYSYQYPYYYGYPYAYPAGLYIGPPIYHHPHRRWHHHWR